MELDRTKLVLDLLLTGLLLSPSLSPTQSLYKIKLGSKFHTDLSYKIHLFTPTLSLHLQLLVTKLLDTDGMKNGKGERDRVWNPC